LEIRAVKQQILAVQYWMRNNHAKFYFIRFWFFLLTLFSNVVQYWMRESKEEQLDHVFLQMRCNTGCVNQKKNC
jgi:hypothetical protein